MAYTYPGREMWDIPFEWDMGTPKATLFEKLGHMSRKGGVNLNKLADSEYGERIIQEFWQFMTCPDEMGESYLAYLKQIGLTKKLHHAEKLFEKWALYLPVSIEAGAKAGRKYPLLFVNHGAHMPIYWEEQSGFLPIAGREEMIVIAAQNHNSDHLLQILEQVKAEYPVDESRIYCTGYSQGGYKTQMIAFHHPRLFAAIAPCGFTFSLPDWDLTEEDNRKDGNNKLPSIMICGQEEVLEFVPVHQDNLPGEEFYVPESTLKEADPTIPGIYEALPTKATVKMDMLNKKLRSIGHREISYEECRATTESDNEVERLHGFPADRTDIFMLAGVRHFISSFDGDYEKDVFKVVSIEGLPHWPPATMAEIAWSYMKKYARNCETGEIIHLEDA
ncbi:MAG: prolyl oligopeptidase family serine peptidase [Clostridia bacterium]|nr:prolyl oligopeptidase family serine peptidase [Clostridia bacterium]